MATHTQTQEVKKAAKRAPKAVAAPAKAAKPAKAKASAKKPTAKAKPAAKGVSYTIANRPSSGVLLFAYTQAMLNLLDMYNGAEVEKATLAKVMGLTAISYHTAKGTMARQDNGRYILTSVGVAFFSERATRAQSAHIDMFTTMAQTGNIVGDIYKNNDQVMRIA